MEHPIINHQLAFWMGIFVLCGGLFACDASHDPRGREQAGQTLTTERTQRFVLDQDQRSVQLDSPPVQGSVQARLSPNGATSSLLRTQDLSLMGAKLQLADAQPAGTVLDVAYQARTGR